MHPASPECPILYDPSHNHSLKRNCWCCQDYGGCKSLKLELAMAGFIDTTSGLLTLGIFFDHLAVNSIWRRLTNDSAFRMVEDLSIYPDIFCAMDLLIRTINNNDGIKWRFQWWSTKGDEQKVMYNTYIIYIYAHIHTYIHTYTYMHACIHTYIQIRMWLYIYICFQYIYLCIYFVIMYLCFFRCQ